jgi:hypothetical protein
MSTISFHKLTKRYGPVLAVDDLSFDVPVPLQNVMTALTCR